MMPDLSLIEVALEVLRTDPIAQVGAVWSTVAVAFYASL